MYTYPSLSNDNMSMQNMYEQMLIHGIRHRLFNRLQGKSSQLLDYNMIRKNSRMATQHDTGLQVVDINAIVGSVGRTHDFDDKFYPKSNKSRERWCSVASILNYRGLPPIELYRIGEQYFVIDGNHRVSIMRYNGQHYVEGHVIEIVMSEERCQTKDMHDSGYQH